MMEQASPDLSIILVNYNGKDITRSCIESIKSTVRHITYEILLVDNGSSDGSIEFFGDYPGITFIPAGSNLGFGRANNLALQKASGRNVIFLNNDTVLEEANPLKIMSDFLDDNPTAGGCGSNLVSPSGMPSVSFSKRRPSFVEEFKRFMDIKPVQFNHTGHPISVDVISGADLMVRHSVLDLVGGFNPSFFMYFEDTELCYRIKKAGFELYCIPQAGIVHIGGASTGAGSESSCNVVRLQTMYASRKQYYLLTRSKFHMFLSDLIWRCTVYSRLFIHTANKVKKEKWSAYKQHTL